MTEYRVILERTLLSNRSYPGDGNEALRSRTSRLKAAGTKYEKHVGDGFVTLAWTEAHDVDDDRPSETVRLTFLDVTT